VTVARLLREHAESSTGLFVLTNAAAPEEHHLACRSRRREHERCCSGLENRASRSCMRIARPMVPARTVSIQGAIANDAGGQPRFAGLVGGDGHEVRAPSDSDASMEKDITRRRQ
jgi:hypothetical protein